MTRTTGITLTFSCTLRLWAASIWPPPALMKTEPSPRPSPLVRLPPLSLYLLLLLPLLLFCLLWKRVEREMNQSILHIIRENSLSCTNHHLQFNDASLPQQSATKGIKCIHSIAISFKQQSIGQCWKWTVHRWQHGLISKQNYHMANS